jgi:hypothetical protein
MNPFDNHEYATDFLEPYAATIAQAIMEAFEDCRKQHNNHMSGDMLGEYVDFPLAQKTVYIHYLVGARLAKAFRDHDEVKVLQEVGNTELLFENRLRLRVNKVNDDLTFCTNNDTQREKAYRNPSGRGLAFGFAEVTPVYAGYRMLPTGELRDIYLIKYDQNEKQWHVGIDGSNPIAVQTMKYDPIVPTPTDTPEVLPVITRKKAQSA